MYDGWQEEAVVHMIRSSDPPLDDPRSAYEIVELTDDLSAQPVSLGPSDDAGGSLLLPSEMSAANVRDPLYQAFMATGFLRPV